MAKPLVEFLRDKPPDIESWVGPRILVPKSRLLVFGEAGIGKSKLVNNLAFALALGVPWIGFNTVQKRVLYWQAEGSADLFWEQNFLLDTAYKASTSDRRDALWLEHKMSARLNRTEDLKLILATIEQATPEVVIFDPLYKMMRGEDTDQTAGKEITDILDGIIENYGCSIVLVHHSRKRQIVDGRIINTGKGEARGHTTLTADWPDVEIQLRKHKDGLEVICEKSRYAEEFDSVVIRMDSTTFRMSATEETIEDVILAVLAEQKVVGMKQLRELVRVKTPVAERTFARSIATLKGLGQIVTEANPSKRNESVVRAA